MERGQQEAYIVYENALHRAEADKINARIDLIKNLDEAGNWAKIVSIAREGGLEKTDLCRELSTSWSTITRWMSGNTAPGPFARKAVKEKLISMLCDLRDEEMSKADYYSHAA